MAVLASLTPRPALPPVPLAGGRVLEFGRRFHLMGVLNVTPDSFSDGGRFFSAEDAVDRALAMVAAGATIIDIGGESTRPGAEAVGVDEEIARVLPVVEALVGRTEAILSIDTTKAPVAEACLSAGAHLVNDISALGFDPKMPDVIARHDAAVVLMHIVGNPRTMQSLTDSYGDVVDDVVDQLTERVEAALAAGIDRERIIVDPGIGFGKTVDQNCRLIAHLGRLRQMGRPVLLGTSRKSFIGELLGGKPADERVWGTAATVAVGALTGADIVRVHDVAQMHDVLRIAEALCLVDGDG